MFDIGFPELLVVGVVTLLILGPERLPEVLRTLGRWVGQARRSFNSLKHEIEREIGADEIRRELHNARIMEQTRDAQSSLRAVGDDIEEALGSARAQSRRALEEARTGIFQDDDDDTDTGAAVIAPPPSTAPGDDTPDAGTPAAGAPAAGTPAAGTPATDAEPPASEDETVPTTEQKHGS